MKEGGIGGGIEDKIYGALFASFPYIAKYLVLPYSAVSMAQLPFITDTGEIETITINYTLGAGYAGCSLVTTAGGWVFKKILEKYDMDILLNKWSLLIMIFLCTIHTHLHLRGVFEHVTEGMLEKAILINIIGTRSNYKNLWNTIKISPSAKKRWAENIFNSIVEAAIDRNIEAMQPLVAEIVGVAEQFILEDKCVKDNTCPHRLEIYQHARETLNNTEKYLDDAKDLVSKSGLKTATDMITYILKNITISDVPHPYDKLIGMDKNKNKNSLMVVNTEPNQNGLAEFDFEYTSIPTDIDTDTSLWWGSIRPFLIDDEAAARENYILVEELLKMIEYHYGLQVTNMRVVSKDRDDLKQTIVNIEKGIGLSYMFVMILFLLYRIGNKKRRVPRIED